MNWREEAQQHAVQAMPREACGLLVLIAGSERYWAATNLAQDLDAFILDPADYAAAADAGEIVAIVHSHPHAPPTPSEVDRMACDATGMTWHIVSVPSVCWERLEPNAGIMKA